LLVEFNRFAKIQSIISSARSVNSRNHLIAIVPGSSVLSWYM